MAASSRPATNVPAGTPSADTQAAAWWGPWNQLAQQSLGHWQQLATQLQAREQTTLQHLTDDARLSATEAQGLSQPLDWLTLQSTLASEASARMAELTEQTCAAWLSFQNQWWRDLEALLAQSLLAWQGNLASVNAGSVGALICPPEDATPGTLLGVAAQAWPVAANAMLNALQHDLQGPAPADTVKH